MDEEKTAGVGGEHCQPSLLKVDPALFFAQLESECELRGITSQKTKFSSLQVASRSCPGGERNYLSAERQAILQLKRGTCSEDVYVMAKEIVAVFA